MIECFEALGECRFDHWAEPGEVSDWGYEFEPGEPVGRQLKYVEALNVATEESQAGNTYDAVVYMLHKDTCSAALLDRFGPMDVGITRVNLPDSRGSIEPVSASNESKDGGKSTFIVADETHLWTPPANGVFKLGKMHQTMVRNLLKRRQAAGWMLETSTMYAEGEQSVAEGTHNTARVASGDSRLLFDHRQASEHWDLSIRSQRIDALKEAYGPAAAWMDLEAIADYWDDPQASEAEFRRFWLNQPVSLASPDDVFDVVRWASPPMLDRDIEPPSRVALSVAVSPDRRRASIGVAGGEYGGTQTVILCHPMRGLADVPAKLAELRDSRDICEVSLAGAAAKVLIPELVKLGIDYVELSPSQMGAACGAFQQGFTDSALVHVGQPELDAAIANAQTRRVGESEQWDRRDIKVDDSPLVSVSAAFYRWGLQDAPIPAIY